MHRYLASGYLLTLVTLAVVITLARGAIPSFDGITAFLMSQAACLALFPAGTLCLAGSKRSVGKLRRFLGFSVAGIDILLAIGACIAIAVIVAGNARFHAA